MKKNASKMDKCMKNNKNLKCYFLVDANLFLANASLQAHKFKKCSHRSTYKIICLFKARSDFQKKYSQIIYQSSPSYRCTFDRYNYPSHQPYRHVSMACLSVRIHGEKLPQCMIHHRLPCPNCSNRMNCDLRKTE